MINNYDNLNLNTWMVRLNKSKCICVFSPTFRLILKFYASDLGTQSALDTVRGLPSSVSLLQNSGYADGLTIGNTRCTYRAHSQFSFWRENVGMSCKSYC